VGNKAHEKTRRAGTQVFARFCFFYNYMSLRLFFDDFGAKRVFCSATGKIFDKFAETF